jgi:hypothetical protein
MPRSSAWAAKHKECQRAVDAIKTEYEAKTDDLRGIHERSVRRLEGINAELQAEHERLSAWALRAYTFIHTVACRCGAADECEAHTLIHDYQE